MKRHDARTSTRNSRRRSPKIFAAAVSLCLLILASTNAAWGESSIVLRTQYPVQGERTELYIQDDEGNPVTGAEVDVTYRPGSSVEETAAVGVTGKSGRIIWYPAAAGIVTLTASWRSEGGDTVTTSANFSVKFASTPVGGVVIMLLAGLLLVGGSVVRILRVLRSGE